MGLLNAAETTIAISLRADERPSMNPKVVSAQETQVPPQETTNSDQYQQ